MDRRGATTASIRDCGEFMLVVAKGEFDIATAPILQRAVNTALADGRDVRIDLSAVDFIDLECWARVSAARAAAQRHGVRMEIIRASRFVRRVVELTTTDATPPWTEVATRAE